ncbi:MAG: hypothetical protein WCS34_05820 [Bacteroidales bacterium]
MRKFIIVVLLALPFIITTSSCSKYRDITIEEVNIGSISMKSTDRVQATLNVEINNPTHHNFIIKDINGFFYKSDKNLAEINLKNTPTIKKNRTSTIPLVLNVHFTDPVSMLYLGLNYKDLDFNEIFLDVDIKANTSFGIQKTKRFKKISVAQLLKLKNRNNKNNK